MTADRELVDDSDEEEFVGFSREELVGASREELGIHSADVEVEKYERSMMKLLRKLSTKTLKATNIPPYSVVNLGLTNILNESHTELNFFELLFTKFW